MEHFDILLKRKEISLKKIKSMKKDLFVFDEENEKKSFDVVDAYPSE